MARVVRGWWARTLSPGHGSCWLFVSTVWWAASAQGWRVSGWAHTAVVGGEVAWGLDGRGGGTDGRGGGRGRRGAARGRVPGAAARPRPTRRGSARRTRRRVWAATSGACIWVGWAGAASASRCSGSAATPCRWGCGEWGAAPGGVGVGDERGGEWWGATPARSWEGRQ
jgi:hypothetical protein